MSAMASGALFETLGVPAALGRTLRPATTSRAANASSSSRQLWRREWGGDPAIVGGDPLGGVPWTSSA